MRPRVLGRAAIVATCLLGVGVSPLRAQSLADVARAEEARRKQIKRPAKVYTNKDLVSAPPPAAPAPPAQADAANTSAAAQPSTTRDEKADGTSSTPSGEASRDKPKDQAYWSGRMRDLLAQLDRDRILAEALQTRVNALTSDFTARDDPAQRRVIAVDRQKAMDELDRMKNDISNEQKAIADLREEARRASVPPGWLR